MGSSANIQSFQQPDGEPCFESVAGCCGIDGIDRESVHPYSFMAISGQ
jgi:hypothetical protein